MAHFISGPWIAGVVAVMTACAGPAQAADRPARDAVESVPYTWRSVRIGAGGYIPAIVFSRVEKGLAYLRTDMGGAYRWDDPEQVWVPLHDHLAESSYFGTESVAPDPVDADVVYLAAGMYRNDPSAILRSRDRGRTWDVFPVPFQMGGNEDGRGLGERLAVDPNSTSVLYFGSRHDGLWRSSDHGETWRQVESFPVKGRGAPKDWSVPTNGGLSFVVFDPRRREDHAGGASRTIFVGSTDAGERGVYCSDDAGANWSRVDGGPEQELLPARAELDAAGMLYLTYANRIGPNGVTDGAVWKLDTNTGTWTDITPDKREKRPSGGYMGISIDRQIPGTLGVTTMNRWGPVDTVWRSTDGGETWMDIVAKSERDANATPYLRWGKEEAQLGWWMSAFAIDPFDSDHAAYATGATVFATRDFSNVNRDAPTRWFPWVAGIEQTAVITLMSPQTGPHLISGLGDLGGFTHEDLDVSPPEGMSSNPIFGNTNTIDDAGAAPHVIVRSAGRTHGGGAQLAYSDDAGRSWQPLQGPALEEPPLAEGERPRPPRPAITVSADGDTFMVMTPTLHISRDRGQTWTAVQGLPEGSRPVADRIDGRKFYALNFESSEVFVSTDGGVTFTARPTRGLPDDLSGDRPTSREAAWPLHATPGHEGDLWLRSKQGLFHSADGGATWAEIDGGVSVSGLGFGKAPDGSDYPTLFAIGKRDDLKAIWRSDDRGAKWRRINDDQHQWGTRFRCIAGDPRIFGRVYVGTDGRGIFYGEPRD